MAQQTSVEWLEEKLKIYLPSIHQEGLKNAFEQAKEIHKAERMYSDEDIMMVIERVIHLKNGWTPEGFSFYKDDNQIKEEVMNLLKNK